MKIKKKIIAWGLTDSEGHILYPLFHTKKEAKKKRFVEDIVKLEICIIRREPLLKQKLTKYENKRNKKLERGN